MPATDEQKKTIDLTRFETPLGTMVACATDEGICLLEFDDRRMLPNELKWLAKHFNAEVTEGANGNLQKLEKQLREYFDGSRKEFDISLQASGSPFQQEVWKELQTIPYGHTRSYQQQAAAMGRPFAIRAIASANGMNRIAIVIPCHRVIGSDGSMTGYGGGLWRKKWLLDLEKANSPDPYQLSLFGN